MEGRGRSKWGSRGSNRSPKGFGFQWSLMDITLMRSRIQIPIRIREKNSDSHQRKTSEKVKEGSESASKYKPSISPYKTTDKFFVLKQNYSSREKYLRAVYRSFTGRDGRYSNWPTMHSKELTERHKKKNR
jgi:hypothetical protein